MRTGSTAVVLTMVALSLTVGLGAVTGVAAAQEDEEPEPSVLKDLTTEELIAMIGKYAGAFLMFGATMSALSLLVDQGTTAIERHLTAANPSYRRSPAAFGKRLALTLGALLWGFGLYRGGAPLRWIAVLTAVAGLAIVGWRLRGRYDLAS